MYEKKNNSPKCKLVEEVLTPLENKKSIKKSKNKSNGTLAHHSQKVTLISSSTEEWLSLLAYGKNVVDAQGQTPYSASIDLYDAIPKYIYDKKRSKVPDAIKEVTFTHRNAHFTAYIQGAISDKDGKFAYLGKSEELIEDILRKLALDGQALIEQGLLGVKFSLYQIHKMLKESGNQRSYTQIEASLKSLANARITLRGSIAGKTIDVSASPLPVLAIVKNQGKNDGQCIATFHPLVTESLVQNTHRLLNLAKAIRLDYSLARRLYKRILHNFVSANTHQSIYHIKIDNLINDMNYKKRRTKYESFVREIKQGVVELKENGIIDDFEYTDEGVVRLFLSKSTISEIIKANVHKQETFEKTKELLSSKENKRPKPRPLPK